MQKHPDAPINFKRLLLILFLYLAFTCCHIKRRNEHWDKAEINPKIKTDSGYLLLDKQKEVFSFGETTDTLLKRSSGVAYFSDELPYNNAFAHLNNCRAHFINADTLVIVIGVGNGFSGEGFVIRVKDGRFYTRPYHYTDAVMHGTKPVYTNVYQKLVLDKSGYITGDSLYGMINFKSIETDGYFNKVEHIGKGIFRVRLK